MAIPSSINIPNLYVSSPLHSALSSLLPAFEQSYGMVKQQQQQDAQRGLQEQLAKMQMAQKQQAMDQAKTMGPLQQQLLQAQIGATQSKALGASPEQMLAQQKSQLENAKNVIQMVQNNPALMQNPQMVKSFIDARNIMASSVSSIDPQETKTIHDISPEEVQALQDYYESKEAKQTIPVQILQQRSRALSSDKMLKDVEKDLNDVLPYLGGAKNIENLIANYAQATGLDIGESRRKINALFNKKVPLLSEELAAGLGTPAAEKAHERIATVADPRNEGYGNVEQIMENLGALKKMHRSNLESIFMSPAQQRRIAESVLAKETPDGESVSISEQIVPRGTQISQPSFSYEEIQAELKRRGLA